MTKDLRYKIYMKRAALQAHLETMDELICSLEDSRDDTEEAVFDKLKKEDRNFAVCWQNLLESK